MLKLTPQEKSEEASRHAWRLDTINKIWMDQGRAPWGEAARPRYPLGWGPGQALTGPDRALVAAYADSFVGPVKAAKYSCDE